LKFYPQAKNSGFSVAKGAFPTSFAVPLPIQEVILTQILKIKSILSKGDSGEDFSPLYFPSKGDMRN